MLSPGWIGAEHVSVAPTAPPTRARTLRSRRQPDRRRLQHPRGRQGQPIKRPISAGRCRAPTTAPSPPPPPPNRTAQGGTTPISNPFSNPFRTPPASCPRHCPETGQNEVRGFSRLGGVGQFLHSHPFALQRRNRNAVKPVLRNSHQQARPSFPRSQTVADECPLG